MVVYEPPKEFRDWSMQMFLELAAAKDFCSERNESIFLGKIVMHV